ncbi:hypothetical protein [uncultured Clostridium sp.]|uniref:hypothetical protein n=1 Tax=uncultured Clostridium sp. TaxID=59620 RepID=UPI00262F19D4|nr:hypothetical protein [uncultured Clostridium sp.]
MNFKTEKDLKIINELMAYCYHYSTKDITVNIKSDQQTTFISLKANIPNFTQSALEKLLSSLNSPRQREVEQYYWQIGGECEFDSELTLVGMMTDKVDITYDNNFLNINLERTSL